ncbi:MAG: serine hydrolase [Desulfobacula sp.]|jgi:CubicO group peptidase (beta-lactamase class C family)|nr:serine hydrolase [Desulfobacula sp.]
MGWRMPPEGEKEISCRGFIQSLKSPDVTNTTGEAEYRSPNTDLLGWIAERVSGRPLRSMLIDIIETASIEGTFYISTDREGTPLVSGGGAMTTRNLASYGQIFVRQGLGVNGKTFGSPAYFERTRKNPGPPMLGKNGKIYYSNQMMTNGRWLAHSGYGGQLMLTDPVSSVAVVFFRVLENKEADGYAYFQEIYEMAEKITLLD